MVYLKVIFRKSPADIELNYQKHWDAG